MIGKQAWIMALVACGQPESASDEGVACLAGASNHGDVEIGMPVTIRFTLDMCFSSTCSSDRSATCAIEQAATTLTIRTTARWTETDGHTCTQDCALITAECVTDALEAGTYTFVFGAGSLPIAVPANYGDPPCIHS